MNAKWYQATIVVIGMPTSGANANTQYFPSVIEAQQWLNDEIEYQEWIGKKIDIGRCSVGEV